MNPEAERKLEMPAKQLIDTAYAGIIGGNDQIVFGSISPPKDLL